jgi:hypothetical protein
LSEGLEEGDVFCFIGFDGFEEGLGIHCWEHELGILIIEDVMEGFYILNINIERNIASRIMVGRMTLDGDRGKVG